MQKLSLFLVLAMVAGAAPLAADETSEPAVCDSCGHNTYGTSIEWADSPSEAARLAESQEKLVFVLHVSGHFENPEFT